MRLCKLFQVSFVGALIFSPLMAQEAGKVHDEALKVLRGNTNQPAAAASRTAPVNETPAERQARLKAEAQQRLQERERQQAERRRQFEDYVKERERLRQQRQSGGAPGTVHNQALDVLRKSEAPATTPPAPAASAPAAPSAPTVSAPPPRTTTSDAAAPQPAPAVTPATTPTPAVQPQSNEDVQQRALEILRNQRSQTTATPSTPVREPAQSVVARPDPVSTAATTVPPPSNADVHQKALDVLRQQSAPAPAPAPPAAPSPTVSAPAAAPRTPPAQTERKPSPELQRRLDEMQRELQAEQQQRRSSAPAPVDDAYKKDLEKRALQGTQQRPAIQTPAVATPSPSPAKPATKPAAPTTAAAPTKAPAAKPALDTQTQEIIRRQDQQAARPPAQPATTQPLPASLDPAAEARAREILRQQQQALATPSAELQPAARPVTQPPVQSSVQNAAPQSTPRATAAVTSSAPVAGTEGQYSKDLEDRARQSLLERAQAQQAATAPQTSATTAQPAPAANPLTTPVTADPQLDRVHTRALDTLGQVQPGEGNQTRAASKQDRLRALTDLYRADKLTPAEYHQRRAQILAEPNK